MGSITPWSGVDVQRSCEKEKQQGEKDHAGFDWRPIPEAGGLVYLLAATERADSRRGAVVELFSDGAKLCYQKEASPSNTATATAGFPMSP